MIRINQIKLNLNQKENELEKIIIKKLKLKNADFSYEIVKKSIDARKKDSINYIYSVDVDVKSADFKDKNSNKSDLEKTIVKFVNDNNIMLTTSIEYKLPKAGNEDLKDRPIIIGSGPAGLFCGLMLARAGFKPLIIEQGEAVDNREKSVNAFWQGDKLNPFSNVQFGEGGAGTFSDGKLNTQIKDKSGRIKKVLEIFAEHGAPNEIKYLNKPHIGTDILKDVVKNIRKEIIQKGGEVLFNTRLIDLDICDGHVSKCCFENVVTQEKFSLECNILILAIGHSSRNTFKMLKSKNFTMEAKAFAVGLRMEHPQEFISKSQYGGSYKLLPTADYKVTYSPKSGRAVYSFCMCPGGFVVNSSSEEGYLCVNGMSYSKRDGQNANSAIITSVTPDDFENNEDPLCGMYFQMNLEKNAYNAAKGKIPLQLYADFKNKVKSNELKSVTPQIKGEYELNDLNEILPPFICESLIDGIENFSKQIKGFNMDDALLSAVESRTSSPVRILRNEDLTSNISNVYPCGEGAGYAGGIVSAAVDGIKVFEKIFEKYKPKYND
ncbi:MAG: FAD-dependent oxidoreductase [Lachnospiraceae bacterium]|nr:FAD-dependent oxidoreductase [Lachnospiraceae bacterium]